MALSDNICVVLLLIQEQNPLSNTSYTTSPPLQSKPSGQNPPMQNPEQKKLPDKAPGTPPPPPSNIAYI